MASTDDVRAGMDEVHTDASYSFVGPRVAEGAAPMDAVSTSLAPQPLAREQPRTEEESEARACSCSLGGQTRERIVFGPAGFGGRLSRSTSCAAAGGGGPRV